MTSSKRILLAVIGNDVHVVANRIIDQFLISRGYLVANLGVACKPTEIIDGIKEFSPYIVILSSLNGEADSWANDFIDNLNDAKIKRPKIILGGNLFPRASSLKGKDAESYFKKIGFDIVLDYTRPLSDLDKAIISINNGNGFI